MNASLVFCRSSLYDGQILSWIRNDVVNKDLTHEDANMAELSRRLLNRSVSACCGLACAHCPAHAALLPASASNSAARLPGAFSSWLCKHGRRLWHPDRFRSS